jgi:hypothetical protein
VVEHAFGGGLSRTVALNVAMRRTARMPQHRTSTAAPVTRDM